MPVVTAYFHRLRSMLGSEYSIEQIVAKLPYLGLDHEESGKDFIRVEYNPNRPDFSTDYGITRGLKGLLGVETGLADYRLVKSSVRVNVDPSVEKVRPFVVAMIVKGLRLDDETIRQVIVMQEDLHNGIGRKRRKLAIGLHNMDVLKPPIKYTTVGYGFRFRPLGSNRLMSMKEILARTTTGREYGSLVSWSKELPILLDSTGNVLSFPPIINGELTRVDTSTKNLFIDMTAAEMKVAEDALSVVAAALSDAGGGLESVEIVYPDKVITTPNLSPSSIEVDVELVNRLLGLNLDSRSMSQCLGRSRFGSIIKGKKLSSLVPRYRFDIMHQVDIAEEMMIGYGLDRVKPRLPYGRSVGRLDDSLTLLDGVRDVLVGLGLVETMGFSLISRDSVKWTQTNKLGPPIEVRDPKSREHEVLRPSLIPSLLRVLGANVHEDYPQRLFEVGRVFLRRDDGASVREEHRVACLLAHASANFTEAKSYLTSFLKQAFNASCRTTPSSHPTFIDGRAAKVIGPSGAIGEVGEVKPEVLEHFRLRTPVSGFEVYLEPFITARKV